MLPIAMHETGNLAYYLHQLSLPPNTVRAVKPAHNSSETQGGQLARQIGVLLHRFDAYFRRYTHNTALPQFAQASFAYICVFIKNKSFAEQSTVHQASYYRLLQRIKQALEQEHFVEVSGLINELYQHARHQLQQQGIHPPDDACRQAIAAAYPSPPQQLNELLLWLDLLVLLHRYSLTEMPTHLLGIIYENHVRVSGQEKMGQVFTPPYLVNWILDEVQYEPQQQLIDPSCGAGAFVLAAHQRQQQQQSTQQTSKRTGVIAGYDIADFLLFLGKIQTANSSAVLSATATTAAVAPPQLHLTTDAIAELAQPQYAQQYDVVVGNPPYMSYNECCKQGITIFAQLKNKTARLNHICGVNLHSTPQRAKKYAPKPNLYAFFVAQALHLLRLGGYMCYVLPQTLLMATDMDTLRYHLAKQVCIKKIIYFTEKVFTHRSKQHDQAVISSSMVIVVQNTPPADDAQCLVLAAQLEGQQMRFVNEQRLTQKTLLERCDNWNFVVQAPHLQQLCSQYEQHSEPMEQYYQHSIAESMYGSRFYFEPGYMIDHRKATHKGKLRIPRVGNSYGVQQWMGYWADFSDNTADAHYIRLRQSNQGYSLLHTPYKIVWSYSNPKRFCWVAGSDVLVRFQDMAIGSHHHTEMLYLFAILNAHITQQILNFYLYNVHEKNQLVGIYTLKRYVRIPRLDTPSQQAAKQQLIATAQQLLDHEAQQLSTEAIMTQINTLVAKLYHCL